MVWDSGSWRPLGEALLVPATVNVHATHDRGGAPWLVLHQTGARGMVARAFRLEGREWILKGGQRATDSGHPGALAVPDLPDAVVSGTALFQAQAAPGYWLEGLPDLPPERRGEVTPLGGAAAAYLAADGLVYLTGDRGASWRRSAWTPWGTGLSPAWRPGEDFRVEPPVGGRRSPLLLAWFDSRIPDQTSVILTEVSQSGSWRELARLPMRLGPPGSEPREAAHLLARDDGTWIVLADGCFAGPAGPALFLSTLRGQRSEPPRRVPIAVQASRRLGALRLLPHRGRHPLHHLLGGEVGGVDPRVGRVADQRRIAAVGVAVVAARDLLDHVGERHLAHRALPQLLVAAPEAHFRPRVEEELVRRVGKDAVPMSRPSTTAPYLRAEARCSSTMRARTAG